MGPRTGVSRPLEKFLEDFELSYIASSGIQVVYYDRAFLAQLPGHVLCTVTRKTLRLIVQSSHLLCKDETILDQLLINVPREGHHHMISYK